MSVIKVSNLCEVPFNFVVDKQIIEGPLNEHTYKKYDRYDMIILPDVKYTDKLKREHTWQILMYLQNIETNSIVQIDYSFFTEKNSSTSFNDIVGVYKTIYGLTDSPNKTHSGLKKIESGKNIGKSNETNIFTQTLLECISVYNKYVREHNTLAPTYIIEGKTIVRNNQFINNNIGELIQLNRETQDNNLYLARKPPMLVEVYGRVRINNNDNIIVDEKRKLLKSNDDDIDIYIQPKIDDIRIIAHRKDIEINNQDKASYTDENMKIELYTRRLMECGSVPNIEDEVRLLFKSPLTKQTYYFDGGIYKHGVNLATINSVVRQESSDNKIDLEYHLFDLFDESLLETPFKERFRILSEIYNSVNAKYEFKYIKLLTTQHVTNYQEIIPIFNSYIERGYEGIIMRLATSNYIQSYGSSRSNQSFKLKRLYDSEFKIVSYLCGKGHSDGALIWGLATSTGKRFDCVPIGTLEIRRELYTKFLNDYAEFRNKYYGKMMTVQYEELSEEGIPLRAQALRLREE